MLIDHALAEDLLHRVATNSHIVADMQVERIGAEVGVVRQELVIAKLAYGGFMQTYGQIFLLQSKGVMDDIHGIEIDVEVVDIEGVLPLPDRVGEGDVMDIIFTIRPFECFSLAERSVHRGGDGGQMVLDMQHDMLVALAWRLYIQFIVTIVGNRLSMIDIWQ